MLKVAGSYEHLKQDCLRYGCLQAPSKRLKSSLHESEADKWPYEPAQQQLEQLNIHSSSVEATLDAIDITQLPLSSPRLTLGLKREVSLVSS